MIIPAHVTHVLTFTITFSILSITILTLADKTRWHLKATYAIHWAYPASVWTWSSGCKFNGIPTRCQHQENVMKYLNLEKQKMFCSVDLCVLFFKINCLQNVLKRKDDRRYIIRGAVVQQ